MFLFCTCVSFFETYFFLYGYSFFLKVWSEPFHYNVIHVGENCESSVHINEHNTGEVLTMTAGNFTGGNFEVTIKPNDQGAADWNWAHQRVKSLDIKNKLTLSSFRHMHCTQPIILDQTDGVHYLVEFYTRKSAVGLDKHDPVNELIRYKNMNPYGGHMI